ncbi:YceI family protein, partial [Craterilacuibacter sp.]|uniref:YceI family protein n=1 Tax=Craterilacuibacter sp. TaxID=2870909 RepID=UPI003F2D6A69
MGVPMKGSFRTFKADAHFDPVKLANSRADIRIATSSIALPATDAVAEAKKPAWFDIARYPEARFVATTFKALPAGRYEVRGKLTLKGVTREISAPFTAQAQGNNMLIEGVLPVSRLSFNIGDGSWRDTETVSDTVKLNFRLSLTKP